MKTLLIICIFYMVVVSYGIVLWVSQRVEELEEKIQDVLESIDEWEEEYYYGRNKDE